MHVNVLCGYLFESTRRVRVKVTGIAIKLASNEPYLSETATYSIKMKVPIVVMTKLTNVVDGKTTKRFHVGLTLKVK